MPGEESLGVFEDLLHAEAQRLRQLILDDTVGHYNEKIVESREIVEYLKKKIEKLKAK